MILCARVTHSFFFLPNPDAWITHILILQTAVWIAWRVLASVWHIGTGCWRWKQLMRLTLLWEIRTQSKAKCRRTVTSWTGWRRNSPNSRDFWMKWMARIRLNSLATSATSASTGIVFRNQVPCPGLHLIPVLVSRTAPVNRQLQPVTTTLSQRLSLLHMMIIITTTTTTMDSIPPPHPTHPPFETVSRYRIIATQMVTWPTGAALWTAWKITWIQESTGELSLIPRVYFWHPDDGLWYSHHDHNWIIC